VPIPIALGPAGLTLLSAYVVLSLSSFLLYGIDKAAAKQGRWRIPEVTLHLVALAGGWPGALAAQRVFRHKTRKQSFRAVFWCTVIANLAALVGLLLRWPGR